LNSLKIDTIMNKGNFHLKFDKRPKTKIRNDLRDFGYRPIDKNEKDWQMKNFALNNQLLFASISYLNSVGYTIKEDKLFKAQTKKIIGQEQLKELEKKGMGD
jgi:hypothetical protein